MDNVNRVSSNGFSEDMKRRVMELNSREASLMNQVASGMRYTTPSEDPESASRVMNYQTLRRELIQYNSNAEKGKTVLDLSANAITNIKKQIERATEIATMTESGVMGSNFTDYAKEVNELIEQAVSAANSNYLGDSLFAGTALNVAPFTVTRDSNNYITAVAYAGNSSTAPFAISETATVDPHTSGTDNATILNALSHIISLKTALNAGNTTNIRSAQTNLVADENNVISIMSTIGGKQMRVSMAISQNESFFQSLNKGISSEIDSNFEQTMLELGKTKNAYMAAIQGTAKVMNNADSLLSYIR